VELATAGRRVLEERRPLPKLGRPDDPAGKRLRSNSLRVSMSSISMRTGLNNFVGWWIEPRSPICYPIAQAAGRQGFHHLAALLRRQTG